MHDRNNLSEKLIEIRIKAFLSNGKMVFKKNLPDLTIIY